MRLRLVAAALVFGTSLGLAAQEKAAGDQWRDDLLAAREQYVLRTRAYTPVARQRALSLVDTARAPGAEPLTRSGLQLKLLELLALTDNAHDTLTFGSPAQPPLRMPFRVAWFPDALVIVRASGAASDLAGGRVEAIDDLTTAQVYERLSRFAGGIDATRKIALGSMLESPELMHAAGLTQSDDGFAVRVTLRGGLTVQRQVKAVRGESVPPGLLPQRLLAPDLVRAETGWRTALSPERAPLVFRDADASFRLEPLLDGAAVYVQLRATRDSSSQDTIRFAQRVLSWIELHQPIDAVIDLRFDAGGDLQNTLAFMRALPSRLSGRVYALISRYTVANGVLSAAALKKAGGDKVVLVGEAPGDRTRFWSDGGEVCLPNSRFCLHYTDAMFDIARGCRGENGCASDQLDVSIGDLAPEIDAPLTADDYLAGRDRALDLVLARLH